MKPDYQKIKDRHRDLLLSLPNVVGVGFGPKIVKGQLTEVMSIKVYVRSKVPEDQLANNECVPKEIEGILTDVEIQAPLKAY